MEDRLAGFGPGETGDSVTGLLADPEIKTCRQQAGLAERRAPPG